MSFHLNKNKKRILYLVAHQYFKCRKDLIHNMLFHREQTQCKIGDFLKSSIISLLKDLSNTFWDLNHLTKSHAFSLLWPPNNLFISSFLIQEARQKYFILIQNCSVEKESLENEIRFLAALTSKLDLEVYTLIWLQPPWMDL